MTVFTDSPPPLTGAGKIRVPVTIVSHVGVFVQLGAGLAWNLGAWARGVWSTGAWSPGAWA